MLRSSVHEQAKNIDKLTATVEAQGLNIDKIVGAIKVDGENIAALARIAEARENRITGLEGGGKSPS